MPFQAISLDGLSPLEQAARLLPFRVHKSTLFRWQSRGVRLGGRRYVSVHDIVLPNRPRMCRPVRSSIKSSMRPITSSVSRQMIGRPITVFPLRRLRMSSYGRGARTWRLIEVDGKQYEEHKEQDFGDARGGPRDAAEPECGGQVVFRDSNIVRQ